MLIGLASAMRCSELAALTAADLDFSDQGVRIRIVRSKADQDAAGAVIGVATTGSPTCPVRALRQWVAAAAIAAGPIF